VPSSAAPVTGGVEPCESTLEHEMYIARIYESPRTTLPYSEDQWQAILESGRLTDRELADMDVRLTMGGEPTFISMDDFESDEWNNAAVGPDKRRLSARLIKRLRERFAPGGLLFSGQGKWYPGEPLPRWSLNCYWRKDGQPIWRDDSLLADEENPPGHGPEHAESFGLALAETLGTDPKWMIPAYEDIYYYLWKERRLPCNVDPLKSNLRDKLERDRIARLFEQGLDKVAGYVIPLDRVPTASGPKWQSGPWFLREETLFLLPGDSPSACACRSTRCHGSGNPITHGSSRPIPPRRATPCRPTPQAASPCRTAGGNPTSNTRSSIRPGVRSSRRFPARARHRGTIPRSPSGLPGIRLLDHPRCPLPRTAGRAAPRFPSSGS
jgi:uncharacterized protein (DUF2126 family)